MLLKEEDYTYTKKKKKSISGYLGECYLHIYKIYVMRRVAWGNRIVSIIKVIFTYLFSDI